MEKKKVSGCGCFLGIIIIIFLSLIIGIFVLYSMNPTKTQQQLTELTDKMYDYVLKINGIEKEPENIQLHEKDKLTEAQKYYFYSQLSEPAQKIYVTIENNIENLNNGVDNIPLPSSLDELANSASNGKELVAQEFQNAWDAFISDKSEYFYLDSSKVCLVTKITTKGSKTNYEFFIGKGGNANYFIDEFSSLEEINKALEEIETVKNDVLKNASGNNYDKILYVHDWIIDNFQYDTADADNNANIYGSMVNKVAICEGYARTFKYMLDELQIPCILVSGTAIDENGSTERHAWNYVYINNNWYAIDTTWDDPIIIGNGKVTEDIRYKYFLKGKTTMNKDHTTGGQVTKNGYEFSYPQLAIDDFEI